MRELDLLDSLGRSLRSIEAVVARAVTTPPGGVAACAEVPCLVVSSTSSFLVAAASGDLIESKRARAFREGRARKLY